MNQPHIIRLRGPWQRTIIRQASVNIQGEAVATVRMPASWVGDLGAAFVGVVCYERMFNRPTGIHEETDLRLRLIQVVSKSTVIRLNGETLGAVEWPEVSIELGIAGKLQARNRLEVEITAFDFANEKVEGEEVSPCGLVGEVHLEIR